LINLQSKYINFKDRPI